MAEIVGTNVWELLSLKGKTTAGHNLALEGLRLGAIGYDFELRRVPAPLPAAGGGLTLTAPPFSLVALSLHR